MSLEGESLDGREHLLDGVGLRDLLDSLGSELGVELLLPVGDLAESDALGFELLDDLLVLPADTLGEVAEDGVLASGLQLGHTEGSGDDHTVGALVGRRDALEALKREERKMMSTWKTIQELFKIKKNNLCAFFCNIKTMRRARARKKEIRGVS